MPLYIAQSGDLEGCHACLTDSHLKDRATQLLIKYKSGALVTQFYTQFAVCKCVHFYCKIVRPQNVLV